MYVCVTGGRGVQIGGGRSREVLVDYEDCLNRNISEFPVFISRLEIQYFAQQLTEGLRSLSQRCKYNASPTACH